MTPPPAGTDSRLAPISWNLNVLGVIRSGVSICLFTETLGLNSNICRQFRGNSVAVNERDGGGNASITAALVLNELRVYLLYCACACARK